MSSVHYKFKSSIDYDTVTFDGLHISLADLKKAIMEQKKIGRAEFDLQVTNAQTSEGKCSPCLAGKSIMNLQNSKKLLSLKCLEKL